MFVEVVARYQEEFGRDDPDTLFAIGKDAEALAEVGRLATARNLARDARDGFRRIFGEANPETRRAIARFEAMTRAASGPRDAARAEAPPPLDLPPTVAPSVEPSAAAGPADDEPAVDEPAIEALPIDPPASVPFAVHPADGEAVTVDALLAEVLAGDTAPVGAPSRAADIVPATPGDGRKRLRKSRLHAGRSMPQT